VNDPSIPTRRDYFMKACALAGALVSLRGKAAESSERYSRNLTKTDIERWMTELSNWGRWGSEDQAGTINLITAAKRQQAAALVKDGVSISMSLDADIPAQGFAEHLAAPAPGGAPQRPRFTWEHIMRSNGAGRKEGFVIDSYSVSFHGSATTHLDALSHFIYDGKIFNGFPGDVINSWGATKNDIMPFKNGILTRGVLMDMPALKGVPFLGDDEAVYPVDLEAWEKKSGVKIESGDAVFVRTGRWRRIAEKGPLNRQMPGLYASCVKWLKQRDISLLGSDGVQDVRPSRVAEVDQPVHQLCLAAVGTPLMDNCDLEALSQAASQRRRWAFLFTAAPLRVPGSTGSPANPIATF
jgi:kynurenine formamidase